MSSSVGLVTSPAGGPQKACASSIRSLQGHGQVDRLSDIALRNAEDHTQKVITYGARQHRAPHNDLLRINPVVQGLAQGVPRRAQRPGHRRAPHRTRRALPARRERLPTDEAHHDLTDLARRRDCPLAGAADARLTTSPPRREPPSAPPGGSLDPGDLGGIGPRRRRWRQATLPASRVALMGSVPFAARAVMACSETKRRRRCLRR